MEFGRGDGWRVAIENVVRRQREAIVESGQGLVDEHVGGGEQRDQKTEAAEENFVGEDAGEDEHLRFRKPDDGGVHAGIFEGDSGDEKDDAHGGKDDEGDAAAARSGKLAEGEFDGAEKEQRVEGEFGADGLIFEKTEKERGI